MWWQLAAEKHMAKHESCFGEGCSSWGKSYMEVTLCSEHICIQMPAPLALLYLLPLSDVGQCLWFFGSQMCAWNPASSPQCFRWMTRLTFLHLWSTVAMYSSSSLSRLSETGFSLQWDYFPSFFFFLLSSCFSIKKMYVSFKMFLKHIWVHCKYYCCCINQKKNQII